MKLRLLKEVDLCGLYKEVSKKTVEKIISLKNYNSCKLKGLWK